ncbi:TetR/AcrR family transcriptional regulator [Actinocatenispora sera]|uniref:TetR family transcriptional regulator n=1 Tax=Actinocatenispora sera TaxID=390989 RepID=A0A810KY02_9ACTN|nr:TetR/AcrR family transcriptional regulator [Actinocatenispora sera]BCJ27121.1 TetR family transcriptional regulator [Actinocatenispora sera]
MTGDRTPQRRGEQLRRHILISAKEVFLETGYERASMDAVAARAGTSKRSLYAHFKSKDALFLAVLELVRELYLGRLRTPDTYASEPDEAVTRYCGRLLQLLVWEPQVHTCRLCISAAERMPASARAYFEAIFASAHQRLADYLTDRYELATADGAALATDLLGRTVLPRVFRTLLGVDQPNPDEPDEALLSTTVDLGTIRRQVAATLPA